MTIIAGFSASRQSSAPLHLAAELARTTGEDIIATAILESASNLTNDKLEREYQTHLAAQTMRALEGVIARARSDVDVTTMIRHSTSIPKGLMEIASEYDAGIVVLGSSSSGLAGRIALGSVTERLVHTASVSVAIAPRGYAPELAAGSTAHGLLRRFGRHLEAHCDRGRNGDAVARRDADRVVHGAAPVDVRWLDRAFGRRPGDATVGATDHSKPSNASSREAREVARPFRTSTWSSAPAPTGTTPSTTSRGSPVTYSCSDPARRGRSRGCSSARPPRRSCGTRRCPS